jgi:hypothetical protein
MRELYIVTTEHKGNGSWNYIDYYRPGISVYTKINRALEACIEYMYKYKYPLNQTNICSNLNSGCTKLDDKHEISSFKRKKLFNHLLNRIELDDNSWIRMEVIKENTSKLKNYTNWYNYPDKTYICHGFWRLIYEYGIVITKKSNNQRYEDFLTRTTYVIDNYIL